MKKVKKLVASILVSALAFSVVGCNLIEKTPEAIQKSPVAKINDTVITKAMLDAKMVPYINQIKAQPGFKADDPQYKDALKQQKQQVVDQLVSNELLLQKAKELKLIPTDKELTDASDKQYNDIKTQYGDDKKFADALKQAGYTEATLKAEMKQEAIMQKVVEHMTKSATVTDDKAKQFYDTNQLQFTEKPATISVSHILVANEDDANKALARINKGEAFDKVAKEVSTDTGSKDKGGDLGTIPQNSQDLVKEFMTAAIVLKKGEVSKPVKSQFGFHIIKMNDRVDSPVKPFDKVKDDIKKQLLDQAKQELYTSTLDTWKKAAKIKTYPENF